MKRLLALILSLILCFSLLVSCNKEEESSSSSSSEEQSSNEKVNVDYLVENSYEYYTFNSFGKNFFTEVVNDEELDRGYKTWFFKSYDEYSEFYDKATYGIDEMYGTTEASAYARKTSPKESDFDNHVVVALFIYGDPPLRFGKLTHSYAGEKKCIMIGESTSVLAELMLPITRKNLCFVLVPKTDIKWEIDAIDIIFYKHGCDITKTPYEYFDYYTYITED